MLIALLQDMDSDCHIRLVRRAMCLVLEAQHEGDCAEQPVRVAAKCSEVIQPDVCVLTFLQLP